MSNNVDGKSIIVTGAGSGFGRLVAEKTAALGAKVMCADINLEAAEVVAAGIRANGHLAQACEADVGRIIDMRTLADATVEAFGAIDVIVNNAGTMPLAFIADHEAAIEAWNRCIDTNLKGVMNGVAAVHDQMIRQGRGHVINISSIYGNYGVSGSTIYGATKAAVNYFSEALRKDTRGKIKVTLVKPTGIPGTGLHASVVNDTASVGLLGNNAAAIETLLEQMRSGTLSPSLLDPENIECFLLGPQHIADAIVHAIDQPWGVVISDITVRAAGEYFVL